MARKTEELWIRGIIIPLKSYYNISLRGVDNYGIIIRYLYMQMQNVLS
jgi:hypothetical protein